jgi:hypothetical protein
MIKTIKIFFFTFFLLLTLIAKAQNYEEGTIIFDGKIYKTMIIGEDTLILADLESVTIRPTRSMTDDERRTYELYKRSARIAYPYAKDAIKILTKLEERTKKMSSRDRKKYMDMTYKQLEFNFKKQIKLLTKSQGMIMIKMIERETNKSFYSIIKENRNGFSAFYWHQLGKFYDYDLKESYVIGNNPVLDLVLKDYYFKPEDSPLLNVKVAKYKQN